MSHLAARGSLKINTLDVQEGETSLTDAIKLSITEVNDWMKSMKYSGTIEKQSSMFLRV